MRLWAVLCGLIGLLISAPGARAGDAIYLADVLRLDEVIAVLRDEGLAYGNSLDQDMLDGTGGAFWADQMKRLYSTGRMGDEVRRALVNGMDQPQIDMSLAFFEPPRGQHILSLETSARLAMSDPEVEMAAYSRYHALIGSNDARLALISRLVVANDLIERNVAGSLNASYYFMSGLVMGGGAKMSEAEITRDVWSQEDETRVDTIEWIYSFMLLAYAPLSDQDLEAYINYSLTPSGQALNTALFNGFDAMYLSISRELGVLAAEAIRSSQL